MADRMLLTGGTGLLSLNWAMTVRDTRHVVLGLHDRKACVAGVEARAVDLESVDGVTRALDAFEPQVVVHTVALTSVEACEADPLLAHHVNVNLAANVALACASVGVTLVHISTDHLFSGDEPLVDETHPVAPLNVYGRTKAAAEVQVLSSHPEALVIRTNFFGWGPSYRRSFSDGIITALRAGQSVTLFRDVFFTPILVEDLVHSVHELVRRKASGVFHVVGRDRVSKCDFGFMLAEQFDLDAGLIVPSIVCGDAHLVRRPRDMSLSNGKISGLLGRHLGGLTEQLARLHEQERAGFAREIQAL